MLDDHGFASYRIFGEECYIRDIWVDPDYRQTKVASAIADKIVEIAKKAECKYLTGSVSTTANGATESIKVLLAYGFKVHNAVPNGIYFRKEL